MFRRRKKSSQHPYSVDSAPSIVRPSRQRWRGCSGARRYRQVDDFEVLFGWFCIMLCVCCCWIDEVLNNNNNRHSSSSISIVVVVEARKEKREEKEEEEVWWKLKKRERESSYLEEEEELRRGEALWEDTGRLHGCGSASSRRRPWCDIAMSCTTPYFAGLFAALGLRAANHLPLPNIIHILADDYGWAGVGYHREAVRGNATDVQTPNLDALVRAGIRLIGFMCTKFVALVAVAFKVVGTHRVNVQNTPPEFRNQGSNWWISGSLQTWQGLLQYWNGLIINASCRKMGCRDGNWNAPPTCPWIRLVVRILAPLKRLLGPDCGTLCKVRAVRTCGNIMKHTMALPFSCRMVNHVAK